MTEDIEDILDFWFGPLDETGMPVEDRNALWFKTSEDTDSTCRERFGLQLTQALAGALAPWEETDRGVVALVILLDQFTRNVFRGTPEAYSGDERALAIAQHTIATGHHRRLPAIHQAFLFMPLEHSEDLEVQHECVELFTELAAVTGNERIAGFGDYARAHREVIARFGRFPHRNGILGRLSTAEELTYLENHGGF